MYTILIIEAIKSSLLAAVEKLQREHPELGTPELVLLTSKPAKYAKYASAVRIVETDYSPASLKQVLEPLQDTLRAVICRGDVYVQYLRKTLPFLPKNVPVASEQALAAATNKRLMRQAFLDTYPEITPQYMQVADASEQTVARLKAALQFPVIIKPASLASSLLIQKCRTPEELSAALRDVFAQLQAIYEREDRSEPPEVIVEEFMEGEFYSIDSYVREAGNVVHCPPVHYVPADSLGLNDFFLYKRDVPTSLQDEECESAYQAASKAIEAVGLQYSSVHVELVKTASGWKIIELGPRIGRFRNIMYTQAYGIDHGYNDLLIHLDLVPVVPQAVQKYCAAYSIYPHEEGVLQAITGLDEVSRLTGIYYFKVMAHAGDSVKFAKNGGHALSEIIVAHEDVTTFQQECAWIEQHVNAVTKGDAS